MTALSWIALGGLTMSAIAMGGSAATVLRPATLERLLLPLVPVAGLVPEIKSRPDPRQPALNISAFVPGLGLVLSLARVFQS